VFGTNLAFQQRDLAFDISFHGKIITKGPPPKCFQAYGVVFFILGRTGTGSHDEPLLIVKNLSCVAGGRNTSVTNTMQCTLGTI